MSETRAIHWPSFWEGFRRGLAIPAYACIAFAGVFRRAFKDDFPSVEYDAMAMWWTTDEQRARSEAAFARLAEEWEREDRETDKSLN